MKPAFSFLLIAVVMLTVVNCTSQITTEQPGVFVYGPTGSVLLRQCEAAVKITDGGNHTTQQFVDGTFCRGYVTGAVDAMVALSLQTATVYCVPSNADFEQILRVVLKYLNDNPAMLHYPAAALVSKAIIAAFPCK